jgi:hypothetical protein
MSKQDVPLPPKRTKKKDIRLKSFENVVKFYYMGDGNKLKLHSGRN